MIDLDALADWIAARYEGRASENFRCLARAHLASGRFVVERDGAGRVLGCLGWLRTDAQGAELVRQFGLEALIYLAVPIAPVGDVLLVLYAATAPDAPAQQAARLWAWMLRLNPGAATVKTWIYPKNKPAFWLDRKLGDCNGWH